MAGKSPNAGPTPKASNGKPGGTDAGSGSHLRHKKSMSGLAGYDCRDLDLRTWLGHWPGILRQLDSLTTSLKRRQVSGPYNCAKCTFELLRTVIGSCKWATPRQLMEALKAIGRELIAAKPTELAVGNMVRRVLYIVREEYATKVLELEQEEAGIPTDSAAEVQAPSLGTILGGAFAETDFQQNFPDLKQNIIAGLSELKTELETSNSEVCEYAAETIHANEVILTFGYSATVEQFLAAAAEHYRETDLSFQVIVAEAAPSLRGHEMAKALAKHGIATTVITDAAVFAIMARVNKVIMPTHAVMANGGLIALSGSHMIALAAKELSVPVVVVTALFKLCPLFPHDQDTFNTLLAPSSVMRYEDNARMPTVEVLNPAYDYIPPELVDLYITNIKGHQPSYIYRLLAEYYHPDDYIISPDHDA